MGVEVAGTELPKVNGEVKSKLIDQENGKMDFSEDITFGTHGVDEPAKEEAIKVSNGNVHQAADEWGETKVHYFWFVKHRSFEDPSLRVKIDQADKEIQKRKQQITHFYEEIRVRKTKKYELIDEKKALNDENKQYQEFINEKREEMKPLQTALGSLRNGGNGAEKGYGLCSSEEELNQLIRSLEYRMQHESLSLKEEKQLLREIKELETTRPKVVANNAERAKIQESLGKKEVIQDQVKLLGTDMDGVRKQQTVIKMKRERLNSQIDALSAEIAALDNELQSAKQKREEAFNTMKQIRKLLSKKNAHLDEYRNNLNRAKDISFQKDVKALEELHHTEIEKFMFQWNSSKAFRDDYVKRSLRFSAGRMLCKDGRMMNDDEKPSVKEESPKPSEVDVVSKTTTPKQQTEVVKTTSKVENVPSEKAPKELKKGSKELKSTLEQGVEEDVFVLEKSKKDVSMNNDFDVAKLTEMKKEEEKEKHRQALERKKKMQEKAATKAAARAQKEAEKKQKEREKKLRKKEASTLPSNYDEELAQLLETNEPEKSDALEEAIDTPAPSKAKVHLNLLKNRKPVKSRGAPPKAILKKKKSDNYLLYGSIAATTLGILLLLGVWYRYFF